MVISGTVMKHVLHSGGVPLVNRVTYFIGLPLQGIPRPIKEMNHFIAFAVHCNQNPAFDTEKLEKSYKGITHSIDIMGGVNFF